MEQLDKAGRIRLLLEHWQDIWDPCAGLSDRGGDGTGVRLMPAWCSSPTVRELEQGLRRLREAFPREHSALMVFYGAETRQVLVTRRHKTRNGRYDTSTEWALKRVLPAGFSVDQKDNGEQRLKDLCRGPMEIPKDLWNALFKPIAA